MTLLLASRTLGQVYRYEAENSQVLGGTNVVLTTSQGNSGTGYVTGFDSGSGSDYLRLRTDVPDGLYEMWVGYRSQYGDKGYDYRVDSD